MSVTIPLRASRLLRSAARAVAPSQSVRSVASTSRQAPFTETSTTSSQNASLSPLVSGGSAPSEAATSALPASFRPTQVLPQTHGVHVCTLHFRAYPDALENLDFFADFARRAAFSFGIPCSGLAHLPTRISLWTVPKSPFVHKKAQENFERRTHSRCIKLWDANDEVVDRWLQFLRIHAMDGVGMKAELFRYSPVGVGAKMLAEARAVQRQVPKSATEQDRGSDAGATTGQSGADDAVVTSEEATTRLSEQLQSGESVKALADQIVQAELDSEATKESTGDAQGSPSGTQNQEAKDTKS